MEIRDLKEKLVRQSYSLRQLEMINAELNHKLKLQVCVFTCIASFGLLCKSLVNLPPPQVLAALSYII
jgi:hypothetical protein